MKNRIYQRATVRRAAAAALAGLALLILAGCHYSLLNRSIGLAAWSPDGTRLAVCIDNAAASSGELWMVEPENGRTTRLLTNERSSGLPHLLAPRWSPDGTTLYCVRTAAGEESERRPASIVGIDLPSGKTAGAGLVHYTGSRSSHFSDSEVFIPLADGTLVAQDLGEDEIYRLVRIDPATGSKSSFAPLSGSWMVIGGAPDGEHLAVAVVKPSGSGMRVSFLTAAGGQFSPPVDLWETGMDGPETRPSLTWSPTGDSLAMVVEDVPPTGSAWSLPGAPADPGQAEQDDFATLVIIEPGTGRAHTVAHDIFGIPPVYSPDGTRLAYAASSGIRDGDDDLLLEVRVRSEIDGSKVTSLPGLALPLAWSADGSRLAYYLGLPEDDNTGSVISVAPDGRGTRVLGRHQQDRLAVADPGGGRLAWVSGDGAVRVIDPGTGRLIFNDGLTAAGTIQAGEDHLHQGRPEEALETWSALDQAGLGGESAARLAAGTYAALHALDRQGQAAERLDLSCTELALQEEPAPAFMTLCGALSDFGFRPEAERLVEQQLLARYPDSPEAVEALWALAALKQTEGDGAAALGHLERLLRSHPEERREMNRGLLLAALADSGADPAVVIELATMIIEANGDLQDADMTGPRAVAHYARGLALELKGNLEQAGEDHAAALAQQAEVKFPDGQDMTDLCWEALFRLARNKTPAARR